MGYLRFPASSRVWSRRLSSDRRASLIWIFSTIKRSMVVGVPGSFGLGQG